MLIVKTDQQLLEEVERFYKHTCSQGTRLKRDVIRKQGEVWAAEQLLEMVRLHMRQASGLEAPECQDHVKTDFQSLPCTIGPISTSIFKCTTCGKQISALNYEALPPARPIGVCAKCNQFVYPFEAYDYPMGVLHHRAECPRRWQR